MNHKPRILIVDDDLCIRQIMEMVLISDYRTESAESGERALIMFAGSPFDLVITDQWMPGMRGDELATIIKQLSSRTPVIMVSGTPPPQPAAFIDSVLRKPLNPGTIREAIARSLALVAPAE